MPMTETVRVWSVLAYMTRDDELVSDERRRVPEPLLALTLQELSWMGFDNIYMHADPDDEFRCEEQTVVNGVLHVWHGWDRKAA